MTDNLFTMARQITAGAKDLAEGTDLLVEALGTNMEFRDLVLDVWKHRICNEIMRAILHSERMKAFRNVVESSPSLSESEDQPVKGESGEKLRNAYTTEDVIFVGMMNYRLYGGKRVAEATYDEVLESDRHYATLEAGVAKQRTIHSAFLIRWVKSKHNQIAMMALSRKQWEEIQQIASVL